MKKIIIFVLVIISLFLFHLSIRYVINEAYISKSNKGYYNSSLVEQLFILNFPESYIAYYNKGNNLYNLEEYNDAILEYEKALKTVSKKRECKVRNNLSLSYMKILNLTKEDLIDDIEYIQDILLVNNCAAKDLVSGKDSNSQEIYNELEKLKQEKSSKGGSTGDKDNNKENQNNNNNEDDSKEKELEEQLKEQQRQTQQDRNDKERDDINRKEDTRYQYKGKNY